MRSVITSVVNRWLIQNGSQFKETCHSLFITTDFIHVGMMIECMAGKSASMHGMCHDATPFTFSEDMPAIDHFGNLLTSGLFFIISLFISEVE